METGDIPFRRLAGEYGVPLYVYDRHALEERCNALRQAFPDFGILYSMKCCPHEGVLQTVTGQGLGIDAASAGEVLRARALGLPRDMIHYSAPGKSDAELAKVLDCCTIVADSYGELARLDALCETRGVTVGAGLRVSPSMAYGPGPAPELVPAGPDKFGVDEESLAGHADFLKSLRHVRVAGVHVYLRSQVLGAGTLAAAFRQAAGIAVRFTRDFGLPLDFANFGGGLGIPYGPLQAAVDLELLQDETAALVRELRRERALPQRLFMESGRWLAGPAGWFVTRITDIKESRGTTFVMAQGLLNHYLRPALARLMDDLPLPADFAGPLEPLWSGPWQTAPFAVGEHAPERTVTVCGSLCTAQDIVARDIPLACAVAGNLLVFPNAGAYAASLSPHGFADHRPVREILWEGEEARPSRGRAEDLYIG